MPEMGNLFENPFPFFAEATDAASKFVHAQRDYLRVTTELRARREAKRAAFMIGAVLFLNIAFILALFWVTTSLHEEGVSAGTLGLLSLLVFGAISVAFFLLGMKAGKAPEKAALKAG